MWLTILHLLLSLASSIAEHVNRRQLMDAGAQEAELRGIRDALDAIDRARAARAAVRDDPDSVRDDPYNRDNRQ